MEKLTKFLKDSGLWQVAKDNLLIINNTPNSKIVDAWNKLVCNDSVIEHGENKERLQQILKIEGISEATKELMHLCEIPYRITDNSGKGYTVRSCSKEAKKIVAEIIRSNEVDIDIFIASTKKYYNNPHSYRKVFSNYLLADDWIAIYHSSESGIDEVVDVTNWLS